MESFIEDFVGKGISDLTYNIFSSIENPFPNACISFTSLYLTPDALGLHRGKNCPITIFFDKIHKCVLDFYIEFWTVKGTESGMRVNVYLTYIADLAKITNQRKSYKDKNAGDVINDVLNGDVYLSRFDREIEKSDHSFNSFRSIADTSVGFIQKTVLENTLIDNSKPYFFVGLDNIARFLSTNSASKKGDNIKSCIDLGSVPENKSVDLGLTQKGVDKKRILNLKADNYFINCGEKGDFEDLKVKNYLFSPNDLGNFKLVNITTTTPSDKDHSVFPVMENMLFFTDATAGKMVSNRPARNASVEVYNEMSESLSQMLKIKVKGARPTFPEGAAKLVSAGTQTYVNTLYAYSALNGLYVIKDVEYMFNKGFMSMNLTLVRSYYDMQYPENKDSMESEDDSVYSYAPVCNKGELLS